MIWIALSLSLAAQPATDGAWAPPPVPYEAQPVPYETQPAPYETQEVTIVAPPQPYVALSPTAHELYSAPPVRPFEPSAAFEAALAGSGAPPERVIRTPAELAGYSGHYEPAPTAGEVAYQQGVSAARVNADSRMGPLDGAWRVTGEDSRALFDILLMDGGQGRLVEGAWLALGAPSAAMTGSRMGVLTTVVRDGETLILGMTGPNGPGELRLARDGGLWRGVLREGDHIAAVVMERAE